MYIYVAKTTIPVAKDVYIRPTSILFLRIFQSPAIDVVVVARLRGVFFVSSLITACSLGSCSLRKQFIYASRSFCPNGGKQRCGCSRCDTSWYKLYVWLLSWRRWSRREWFHLVESEGDGNDNGDWLGEETSDGVARWKNMTTLLAALLWTSTSMFQLVSARLRQGTVGTNVREWSRVKHSESAVRRTSKRERCVKELVNNNQTLEWPSKVKIRNPHIHHRCFLCSVGGPVKISTSGVGAGTQAVTAPEAFAFKLRKNRNFGPPYVWITLLFDHVVSHFEFV